MKLAHSIAPQYSAAEGRKTKVFCSQHHSFYSPQTPHHMHSTEIHNGSTVRNGKINQESVAGNSLIAITIYTTSS